MFPTNRAIAGAVVVSVARGGLWSLTALLKAEKIGAFEGKAPVHDTEAPARGHHRRRPMFAGLEL